MERQKELEMKHIPARADIMKDEDRVILHMEMPGVDKDGVDVRVDGDQLIIQGRKSSESVPGEYRIREIAEGHFYNEFTLDDTIDREKIDAAMDKGILTLTLHLKEAVKPRRIQVQSL